MLDFSAKEARLCSSQAIKGPLASDFVSQLNDELEDHLIAINENTNEIQANYEYLCELDNKMAKLTERLDQIQMFLQKHGFKVEEKPFFEVKKLTSREQEVFLILYTLEESKGPLTYLDIARRTGLTEDLVAAYITNMVQKGVPILKRYINNQAHLRLDPVFKQVQAKENILQIEQKVLSFD